MSVQGGFIGDGLSWRETRTLRWLPDGRLEIATDDRSATRVRCAAG